MYYLMIKAMTTYCGYWYINFFWYILFPSKSWQLHGMETLSSLLALCEGNHYNDFIMGTIASQIHQPHDCLLNRLFRRRSNKTSKLRVTGLCAGEFPHKWPVTLKMFPFDDVIMSHGHCPHKSPAVRSIDICCQSERGTGKWRCLDAHLTAL